MTEVTAVVEVNPVVFVKKIIEEIRNGNYLKNVIEGYPVMGLPNYINLYEGDEPEVIHPMGDDIRTVVVSGYEIMRWLLDVQDMVVQGFILEDISGVLVDNLKSITLQRPAVVSFELEEAPESATEAPKPKAKRTPKPKSE